MVCLEFTRSNNPINSNFVYFKIYTNRAKDKQVISNIETVTPFRTWSENPNEKEILILPNFCFVVLDIVKKDSVWQKGRTITWVTIAEIPFQEMFTFRPTYKNQVVLIDHDAHVKEFEKAFSTRKDINFCNTENADEVISHL